MELRSVRWARHVKRRGEMRKNVIMLFLKFCKEETGYRALNVGKG
jgi:hypothetical protein